MLNFYDYVANSKYYKTFKVDDLLMVEYKCLIPGDRVFFWTHTNYFAFILSGEIKYHHGDRQYIARQGDSLFVRKGAYIASQHGAGEYCAVIIFLTDEFIHSVVTKYRSAVAKQVPDHAQGNESVFPIPVDESLSAYFHSLLSYFTKETAPGEELLRLKFEEVVLNVLSNRQNPALANCMSSMNDCGKIPLREVMERSFMLPMSLDEYARLSARSLSAFKADFKEVYGMSPGKWLIRARIQYARQLIETSGETIAEIASKSGFKNTTHFVKVFKETYGVSPLQHRLRTQEQDAGECAA